MTLFYYDGDKIEKYANFPNVSGFTMNSTFIKQSGYSSYIICKTISQYRRSIAPT